MADNRYCIDYARLGTAGCKKCKVKIEKGSVRIAKVVTNPFSDEGGDMKQWYHVRCIFETFVRARATTKKIEDPTDLEGWDQIKNEDRQTVLECIKDFQAKAGNKVTGTTPKQSKLIVAKSPKKRSPTPEKKCSNDSNSSDVRGPDNSFREFRRLCANIAEKPSYNAKTSIVGKFLSEGTSGDGFRGNLYLWVKLLLPGIAKRVYNIQSKQLVKLFSQIFETDQEEMIEDLEQGDVAETITTFYEKSSTITPVKKSSLYLQEKNFPK